MSEKPDLRQAWDDLLSSLAQTTFDAERLRENARQAVQRSKTGRSTRSQARRGSRDVPQVSIL